MVTRPAKKFPRHSCLPNTTYVFDDAKLNKTMSCKRFLLDKTPFLLNRSEMGLATKQKFLWLVNVSGHLPKNYFEPCKIKNLFQTKDQDMYICDCAALKEAAVHTAGFIVNSQLLDTFNKISQSQLQ